MTGIDRSKLLLAAACATFAAAAVHSVAFAQETPPPAPAWHAKNLKVLPADIGRPELIATMKTFALSLGVRCTFCHVGTEGQPLSTFDFPSDANPHKNVARAMLRMTKSLNEELPRISGHKDAAITCYTCHRGAKEPVTALPETPPPTTVPPAS